jgi:hypothetical protein
MTLPKHANRKDAARILTDAGYPIAPATLAHFASKGGGPSYKRYGHRAIYETEALFSWAEERLGHAAPTASEHRATRPHVAEAV